MLLARRVDTGNWELPGGQIEPGETATGAAVREVREETGIAIAVTGLAGVFCDPTNGIVYPAIGEVRQQHVTLLHATPRPDTAGDPARPRPDRHETDATAWIDLDELTAVPIHPSVHRRLDHTLRHLRGETDPWSSATDVRHRDGRRLRRADSLVPRLAACLTETGVLVQIAYAYSRRASRARGPVRLLRGGDGLAGRVAQHATCTRLPRSPPPHDVRDPPVGHHAELSPGLRSGTVNDAAVRTGAFRTETRSTTRKSARIASLVHRVLT